MWLFKSHIAISHCVVWGWLRIGKTPLSLTGWWMEYFQHVRLLMQFFIHFYGAKTFHVHDSSNKIIPNQSRLNWKLFLLLQLAITRSTSFCSTYCTTDWIQYFLVGVRWMKWSIGLGYNNHLMNSTLSRIRWIELDELARPRLELLNPSLFPFILWICAFDELQSVIFLL